MANEKLIDLELLSEYDRQIKSYIQTLCVTKEKLAEEIAKIFPEAEGGSF